MASSQELDSLFIDITERVSLMSKATRAKVGAVVVKDGNILSMGWNGMPQGWETNVCEDEFHDADGKVILRTKPEVLHAEANSLLKLVRDGGRGVEGGTLYTSWSPCPDCAKLAKQAGIVRVVYKHEYRLTAGLEMLKKLGIEVLQHKEMDSV
jgi:dCMP deaminase